VHESYWKLRRKRQYRVNAYESIQKREIWL